MANVFFELERLRSALTDKGVDTPTIEMVVREAQKRIQNMVEVEGDAALQLAVERGVDKRSPEFINELRLDAVSGEIATDSGNTDFSTPPFPMLSRLLQNAEPMADGSGVYKVIPVGKPGNRPPVSTNIYDAQKKIYAERAEAAKARYQAISPAGSKTTFRTATSKQDPSRQWVQPAKEKDFTDDLKTLNDELGQSIDDRIRDIIGSYIEMF